MTAEGSMFSMKFFALLLLPCLAYAPAVGRKSYIGPKGKGKVLTLTFPGEPLLTPFSV